jgi:3-isopropylmalate/(R)-2-methylmalate dehydratase small subunit
MRSPLEPLVTLTARAVVIPHANIDTDQVTPARFLRTTGRSGLREVLFADWRREEAFPLNAAGAEDARVLVAGDNFGCGSSREHAPWALAAWGFRVIISSSFADIFRSNCGKNGILAATVRPEALESLTRMLAAAPATELTVDLPARTIAANGEVVASFGVDVFTRRCLLEGLDELGYLLAQSPAIDAWELGAEQ